MLTSRCLKLDWLLPLLKIFIQYLLCCFIKTGHAQGIWIILCCFTNWLIIYLAEPVYYCPGHPSNTISSGALKFYIGFKKVTSEPLEHCDFVDPQGRSWRPRYQNNNNLDYLQLEIVKINTKRDKNIVVPTLCGLSKQTLSQLIYQRFGHVSITRLKWMARKVLMEGMEFPKKGEEQ